MKLKCSVKTLSRAFWAHGIHFRPLFEKPDLSAADVKARRAWAEEHRHRSHAQWNKYLHAVIDNKTFQIYHTGKAREHAARRQVRGAYRPKKRVFTPGYTKPPSTLIQNTGAKSATGHLRHWQREGAHVACHARPLERRSCPPDVFGTFASPLKKEYPDVRGNWRVLEDNDPSGYKSTKSLAGKSETGITSLDLPKQSPDLNPLDFSFWAMVNKKMRQGTPEAHSAEHVIVGATAGRVQQVIDAGGYFPEGGNK